MGKPKSATTKSTAKSSKSTAETDKATAATGAGKAASKDANAQASDPEKAAATEPAKGAEPAAKGETGRQIAGLIKASHPRQALALAIGIGVAALLSGRPAPEAAMSALAVLLVSAITGLGNDVADRNRDRDAGISGKPIAEDRVPAGNATFVIVLLLLIAIPASLQNGWAAGVSLLATLPVAWLYNKALRRTALSFLPWAVSAALLVAFLAYGGWGWGVFGGPPTGAVTGAAALLAIGVHFLTSLPDLVADNKTGVRHLPLRVALKTGAPRLLIISVVYTVAASVAVVIAALAIGLRQAPLG